MSNLKSSNSNHNLKSSKKLLTSSEKLDNNSCNQKEKCATFLTDQMLSYHSSNKRNNSSKSKNSAESLNNSKKNNKIKSNNNNNLIKKKTPQNNNNAKKNSTTFSLITSSSTSNKSSTSSSNSSSNANSNNSDNLNIKSETNIRARYWSYLFDNLKRSINEIYLTCENDNSISECKQVILILENCTNDFRSLINRIKLINEFEIANRNNKRPSSVAWELTKSTNILNNSNLKKKLFECNKNVTQPARLQQHQQQQTGFREFKPSNFQATISNRYNFDEDEDYYEDEDNDSDYLDSNNKKNNFDNDIDNLSDHIDQLNHETFSDMQSINTEDVSLNTLSPSCDIKLEPYFADLNKINNNTSFFSTQLPTSNQQSNATLIQQDSFDTSNKIMNPFMNLSGAYLNNSYPIFNNHNLNNQVQKSNSFLLSNNNNNHTELFNYNNYFDDLSLLNNFTDAYNKLTSLNNNPFDQNNSTNSNNNKNVMLKFYEEEEENIQLEIKQDKQLLSLLAQEEKLTKQLSVEKLFHYNHQYEILKNTNYTDEMLDDDYLANSKVSTDFDTNDTERNTPLTVYWNNNKQSDLIEDNDTTLLRTPPGGRTAKMQIHEKLSHRKTSPNERKKRHEEKQQRAQEKREKFYQDRLNKLRELTKKIQEVNELKKKLLKAKKVTMKAKMQRAEEKRLYLLNLKATKAAVEEQKVHEIAFINSLAAQNRKHDILERYEKRHEAIKQNLEEERLRKQEEQKAKEQAAELRRKELEAQRVMKLKEMLEKRKIKQSKIEQTQLEKEKERIEMARAKEKTREMRLAVIEAQYQANRQQTKKRIMQKQEEWSKRHESNLEEIRKKAFEMTILRFSSEDHNGEAPTPLPYEKAKFCNVCNVIINSEVKLKSHLNGSKHQQLMNETNQGKNLTKSEIEEYNLNCIIDVPKEKNERELFLNEERRKWMKKRVKKIKSKIFSKGVEYETANKKTPMSNNNSKSSKTVKLIKDLERNNNEKLNNLDRNLSELNRIICQKHSNEQEIFKSMDAFSIGIRLLETISQSINDSNNTLSYKSMINILNMLNNAVKYKYESSSEILLTNKLFSLIEILNLHSSCMTNDISDLINSKSNQKLPLEWLVCSSLIQLVATVFNCLNQELTTENNNMQTLSQRANDIISLITSFGIIDNLSVFFNNVITPLDDDQHISDVLHNCLEFLISITKFLSQKKANDIFSSRKTDDSTQFIATLKITNLVNIISMLYGMLHKDASTPVKFDQSPNSLNHRHDKKQPHVTLELTNLSFKLLNQMIILDLNMIQNLLGEESLSLQLRHICSYLIWYLSVNKYDELLHEIILFIGYFSVLNSDNQLKIELGTPPTILQQLCNLPFNYFSDKNLISILYPTLISCCYDNEKNKQVLANELNTEMMANFIEENSNEPNNSIKIDDKFEFSKRFPSKFWKNALDYYSNKKN